MKKGWKSLPVVYKSLRELNEGIPENLIGIHGKLYDVKDFKHPGGNIFTHCALGTDATSLYESHHIKIEKANKLLFTLPIRGTYERKLNTNYDIYRTLRAKVSKLYNRKRDVCVEAWIWFTIAIVVHILQCVTSLNLILLSGIVSTIAGGYGHNGVHVMSPEAILLDWNGLSAYEWIHEHIMSHHMYTNTDNDHDAISMEPFIRWLPHRQNRILDNKFTKHIIYMIGEIVVAIQGMFIHRTRWQFRNRNVPIWLKLAPFLFVFRTVTLLYYSGIYTTLCTYVVASYIFSYLAHLNHKPEYLPMTDDFLEQQTSSTKDIVNYIGLPGWALLFLDRQVLHHLFPTINQITFTNKYWKEFKSTISQ